MREIIPDWTTPAGGGFVSVMYFDPTILVETQRAALGSLWSAIDAGMPPSVSWVVRTEGRVLSSETGTLTGQWTEGTVYQDSGDATGTQPLPDAVQGLIRWRTDSVVRGRFLQGRTFIPGLNTGVTQSGNLSTSMQTIINGAASDFLDDSGLLIWSRPTQLEAGQARLVVTGTAWSELAVQRGRR